MDQPDAGGVMRGRFQGPPPPAPEKPPVLTTKAALFVALWRLRVELDGLDWEKLAMTDADIAEAKRDWAAIVEALKAGLAKAKAAQDA